MATEFSTTKGTQAQLPIGGAIFDREGEQFAYVKEVKGGYFKLDLPMARDTIARVLKGEKITRPYR